MVDISVAWVWLRILLYICTEAILKNHSLSWWISFCHIITGSLAACSHSHMQVLDGHTFDTVLTGVSIPCSFTYGCRIVIPYTMVYLMNEHN